MVSVGLPDGGMFNDVDHFMETFHDSDVLSDRFALEQVLVVFSTNCLNAKQRLVLVTPLLLCHLFKLRLFCSLKKRTECWVEREVDATLFVKCIASNLVASTTSATIL